MAKKALITGIIAWMVELRKGFEQSIEALTIKKEPGEGRIVSE